MITALVQVNSVGGWTDRTDHILTKTLQRSEVLSREANTIRFSVRSPAGIPKPWTPTVNDAIKIIGNDGTTVEFLGTLIEINRSIDGLLVTYDAVAKDQTHKLDAKTVLETYTGQTVNAIIASIITNYAPSFNVANVHAQKR